MCQTKNTDHLKGSDGTPITLAEALIARKALKLEIDDLSSRVSGSLLFTDKRPADESFDALVPRFELALARYETLICAIMRTNAVQSFVFKGTSVTFANAIILKEVMNRRAMLYNGLLQRLANRNHAYNSGIDKEEGETLVMAKSYTEVREQHDGLRKDLRELDIALQASNWGTRLVEV